MRSNLKFQLEMYLTRLMDIIISENTRITDEQREIALESLLQLLRIPGLVTELYLNYDCDLYCSNLFEDLMKLLSKNAFPVSGLYATHVLSLDALLAVIDSIEQHCHHRVLHATKKHDDSTSACIDNENDLKTQFPEDESEEHSAPTEGTTPPNRSPGHHNLPKVESSEDNEGADIIKSQGKEKRPGPRIRPNRMKVSTNIPSEEELAAIKYKKKIYHTGSEQFNMHPSKGIKFLQEHHLLKDPLDPGEVVQFLKENPKLDKKQIGEFISNRKNSLVLEAFQKSFIFDDVRIDEALRMYLESFRLPGEAPVISYLLEQFADHWHKMNGEPFANTDAAFTLAYATLMLNTDQHNTNAKKQNLPMTSDDFKRNLRKVNGGQDFDEDMLEEIFNAIREDEIVMPAEQVGLVRENYLWKMLIRRGSSKDGLFIHASTGSFDRDLFALVWGPTVAALSFVFDKSMDDTIIQKATSGFRKCAMISAHYSISDVFDNLVISLCKFTTLLSTVEHAELIPISFGNNNKAQLAARTVFGLAHRHGDILREGWKNILDCMLQLYRAKLLPETLVQVEDFISPAGKICIIREEAAASQRAESGVLSSFYSYFTLTEPPPQRGPSTEEVEGSKRAHKCITECHVEQLVQESKFLQFDSLQELLKALIFASQCHDPHDGLIGLSRCDEDSSVFFLELLVKVVLENRDRIGPFWQNIRDHLYNLIVNATEPTFLVQRAVVGLQRLAIRLLRREEIAAQVLASMRILLMMKPAVIHAVSRHIAYGVHDLLTTNAANIHSMTDWYTLFTLLEVVGAGTNPPLMAVEKESNVHLEAISESGAQSDSEVASSTRASNEGGERGYTSDSELYEAHNRHSTRSYNAASTTTTNINGEMEIKPLPDSHGSWVLVYNKHQGNGHRKSFDSVEHSLQKALRRNQFSIDLNDEQCFHDSKSLTKCCETLAFLVRDAAHVTPHNFESCVHAIRTFVEASLNGGRPVKQNMKNTSPTAEKKKYFRKHRKAENQMSRSKSSPSHLSRQDSDEEKDVDSYHSLSIQLLDLMHTLHTRAATIFSSWAEEAQSRQDEPCAGCEVISGIDAGTSTLWTKCWCPLLQGIACLCCDSRRTVRSQALTYLQRALLVHDLQTLSAHEWESCFNKVLFPLLSKLLEPINSQDPSGIEETRMRASTLLCKVFLQHLSPLLSLSTFTALWLTILDFMDKYMHADKSDLLCEAIPESLKNMLLVMHTAGILDRVEAEESQLWKLTWDRIDTFLPKLRDDVFKPHGMDDSKKQFPGQDADDPILTAASISDFDIQHQPVVEQPIHEGSNLQKQQFSQHHTTEVETASSVGDTVHNTENSSMVSPAKLSEEDKVSSVTSNVSKASESISSQSQMILHPPLPLLLNPDLVHSANIPILSPQSTPEKKTEEPADL